MTPQRQGEGTTQHRVLGSSLTDRSLHSQDSNELLSLRFSDGDMVIKLGASPDKWLLVHKEVIKVAMPILGVGLSTQWSHPDLRTNPITGVEVEVHTLGMKFADGTHVLEGKVSPL